MSFPVSADVVDARIKSVMLMDDNSGVGTAALDLVNILEAVHAPSGLVLVPSRRSLGRVVFP